MLITVEYNGKIYTRRNSKWIDACNIVVYDALQNILNHVYLQSLDYSNYTVAELVEEGDKLKESTSYSSAIYFYEKALEECDELTHKYILPRITFCYRKCNMPRKVIDLFAETKKLYGTNFITPVLLTSVTAAYCDLEEYENALKCCKWAYKKFGKFDPNLSNVLKRIHYAGLKDEHFLSPNREDIENDEQFLPLNRKDIENDEQFLPLNREDIENNEQFCAFKAKYKINLNEQQERALLAVEGANLLLAVPGSGKTTVLVARLGYMVLNKNILPENILAITYNTAAAKEMESRFSARFGEEYGKQIDFRTINSLAFKIYMDYCRKIRKKPRTLLQENERRHLLGDVFKQHNSEYAAESDILNLSSVITYIKNMMLTEEQIQEIDAEYPHLSAMYKSYQQTLKNKYQMDFDDQMVFAFWILRNDDEITSSLKTRYKYICVDEAQDTSKIQHEIIKILAHGNNLFMVGDEDQSIYGFRAAYPQALLNFRHDYLNPYILRIERNYRSTNQIVNKAQSFISQNKGRYEKNMTAERGDGEAVTLEQVDSRETQYIRLLEIAKTAKSETAFLYRDNESSVVLIDLFLRNSVPFTLKKPEMNFFGNRIVKDIVAYLSLALNENDVNSFSQICNKGIIYLKNQQKDYAINNCKYKHISVYDAVEGEMQYLSKSQRGRAKEFKNVMFNVSKSKTAVAISTLMRNGYDKYLKNERLDNGKVEILSILAKQEPNIQNFLNRLKELENLIQKGFYNEANNTVILSTIHSSKGLEYDNVYMVDVYDGRFPSSKPNIFCQSKNNTDGEQEERRLFYVGITRAKNRLSLFDIKGRKSTFINQLFPEQKTLQENKKNVNRLLVRETQERRNVDSLQKRIKQEQLYLRQELLGKNREKTLKIERARQNQRRK